MQSLGISVDAIHFLWCVRLIASSWCSSAFLPTASDQAGLKSLQKYFQFQLVEFGVVVCLGGVGAGMSMGCGAGEGV